MYFCRCCGKPLTDPVSIELGIGPVCQMKRKHEDANDMNQSLFPAAVYGVRLDGVVLAITDQDRGRTVTNDVRNVIAELRRDGYDVDQLRIMYCDTDGVWDGIATKGGEFDYFFPLRERDYSAAKAKLLGSDHH